ncbi:RNA polymerase sigma factor [Candidatus Dojkabacteria bacterium]|nr:RNA polymerase sigma factor [Candidatus Dojkabacteria bacterium]
MNESKLVQTAQNGDSTAMQALYEESVSCIYRFVYSFSLGKEVTDDIVAESFTKAFEKLKQFRGKSSFKTWVYKIARNEVYTYFNKKRGTIPMDEEKIEQVADRIGNDILQSHENDRHTNNDNKNERLVRKILNQLPARQAEVLRLRFILGYTVKECALELKISEGNVKVIQNRALGKANKLVNKENG